MDMNDAERGEVYIALAPSMKMEVVLYLAPDVPSKRTHQVLAASGMRQVDSDFFFERIEKSAETELWLCAYEMSLAAQVALDNALDEQLCAGDNVQKRNHKLIGLAFDKIIGKLRIADMIEE